MKSRWFIAAASALALAVFACGKPVSSAPTPHDRNVLTYDEIINSAHAGSDLYEAVQGLRPHFLEPPPGVQPGSVSHTGTVYIDARRAGGLDVLRSLTASTVEEVRYLGPTQSQNEYGPRATLFTLVVRLRRPRPDTTFGVTLSSR
ncbi:MAG TPA: hypothetical protein VGQ44_16760 [Gemmatimonadaceae bacterium]|jgi:hypothetical protein|nr:hypothetical protein [Gemmatimonadaceae bacterium]